MIKVTDNRAFPNAKNNDFTTAEILHTQETDNLTDDDIMKIIELTCLQTHRAVPTDALTSTGIDKSALKRLARAGKLNVLGLQDMNGTIQKCYYPASFEAYKVDTRKEDDDTCDGCGEIVQGCVCGERVE